MFQAEDVISIYQYLQENGIQVWLTGGWGIDALLEEQTRPHKDVDIFILFADVLHTRKVLSQLGYTLKDLWSENRWVTDAQGVEIPTAFVLQDSEGREIDIHALYLDEQGNGLPAWEEAEGFMLTRQDLAGRGVVAGHAMQCITPEMQRVCHTGYELPEKQIADLELLKRKFKGIPSP